MRVHKTLLSNLTRLSELILQHRIDTKKTFIDYTKAILCKIHEAHLSHQIEGKPYNLGIIQDVILSQYYAIRNKLLTNLKNLTSENSIRIIFKCIEKVSGQLVESETWIISFTKSNPKSQKFRQQIGSIIQLYETVIKGLKYQPIFHQIISNKETKNKYIIDYQIQLKTQFFMTSLIDFDEMWQRFTNFDDHNISIRCYFQNFNTQKHKINSQIYLIPQRKYIQLQKVLMKKKSIQTQITSRKISLYQYYDEDLDVTVLSSDSQDMKRNSKKVKQLQMQIENQQLEDVFQLLIEEEKIKISQDQQFLIDNYSLFNRLGNLQSQYYN